MIPGSIDGSSNWNEPTSLARTVEEAMVVAGVLNVSKEARATTKDRREGFVAIATGLINYLQQNMDLQIAEGALRSATDLSQEVPAAAKTLSQVAK